ncbi:MAG: fibronectin type III domain-containing protein [candidate division Zixibacteria bacterium]|nr:fibronectin type III domain-containing protein [candidate division Zixibacteria bacterium]
MYSRRKPFALYVILFTIIFSLFGVVACAQDEVAGTELLDPVSQRIIEAVGAPLPATGVEASDKPNDGGGSIVVTWVLSADDHLQGSVTGYTLQRAEAFDGPFVEVGSSVMGATQYEDGNTEDGLGYYYRIMTLSLIPVEGSEPILLTASSETFGPVSSSAQWFDWRRINVLVGTALLSFFIIFFIQRAKSGKKIFIRKIAGMDAVDEAVGRATEMGKKIFYVPGINDMDNVQTIASMTILGRVAELAAQYDTWLEVPVCRSLVLVTAKEVVREAYTRAGRPDSFQENQVHYITDDQFGYAAAIDGMVVREKPATIFYMGAFFAESLVLAETGNAAGAIQIAGTAMPAQLPFFVTACDYTLIGEELFAASAYLSGEPKLLGSLKGQDYGKAVFLILIIVGVIAETFGIFGDWEFSSILSVIQ